MHGIHKKQCMVYIKNNAWDTEKTMHGIHLKQWIGLTCTSRNDLWQLISQELKEVIIEEIKIQDD